jgi:hypothetical protein
MGALPRIPGDKIPIIEVQLPQISRGSISAVLLRAEDPPIFYSGYSFEQWLRAMTSELEDLTIRSYESIRQTKRIKDAFKRTN